MKKWLSIACLWFACILIDQSLAHTNPCPEYWRYVRRGGNYEGYLTVTNPPRSGNVKVKLILSISGILPTDFEGSMELLGDENSARDNQRSGRPIQYKVLFPTQDPLPVLLDFSVNDIEICHGPKAHGQITTAIKLYHTLGQNNQPQRPFPAQSSGGFQFPGSSSGTATLPNAGICGQTDIVGQSLVVHGDTYKKGEWPWLVALFLNNEFICAGTLVSANHVITAAHCIHNKEDNRKRFSNMHFALGAHNLNDQDLVTKTISTFITHPDWDPHSEIYDADLALAVLSSPVQFTRFVRPACLYTPGIHPENIVGQMGTLAGWGKVETNEYAKDNPRMVTIPIVSDTDCLRSNPVFNRITSRNTFCAGKPGKGPCSGDSGGGLFVPFNGKWVLRGVVSASLRGDILGCDVDHYAVFTKVANYDGWIRSFIE